MQCINTKLLLNIILSILEINILYTGIIIGFAVSAPVGPVAVLCLQKTLSKGFFAGLFAGLGAASADMFYSIVAGFSLTFISDFLIDNQFYIRILGGAILVLLGIKILRTDTAKQIRNQRREGSRFFADFMASFAVTISNPITILAFITIFSSVNVINADSSNISIILLILSVLAGSMLWWLFLVGIVFFFKKRVRLRTLWWINKIMSILIILFAIFVMLSVFIFDTSKVAHLY